MRPPLSAFVAALVAVVTVFAGGAAVEHSEQDRHNQERRATVTHQASAVRARLEGELLASVLAARALVAYVASSPKIDDAQFNMLAEGLVAQSRHVSRLSLAPDNVVRHVYPSPGAEAVLGADLARTPEMRETIERIMRTGQPVVTGPIIALRGPIALVVRAPVWVKEADGNDRFWGSANVLVNLDTLLQHAGMVDAAPGLTMALRGLNGRGAEGEVFFGDAALFQDGREPVLLEVAFPNGTWLLAAEPLDQWRESSPNLPMLRAIWGAVALLVGALVFIIVHDGMRIRHLALHDPLTGLANRSLLGDRLALALAQAQRLGGKVAVLHLDLDEFKPINDRHGHRIGDLVLKEVANRLRRNTRESDSVARIGGDEFVVVLPNLHDVADAEPIAAKVLTALGTPVEADGISCGLGASIGIAVYPEHGADGLTLIRNADRAMYRAKKAGKHRVRVYEPENAPA